MRHLPTLLAGIAVGALGVSLIPRSEPPARIVTRTRVDTVRLATPTPVELTVVAPPRPVKVLRDTDTVVVTLPVVQRQYADTTYRAWVSGIDPRLDSIHIYPRTTTVTLTRPAPRWALTAGAGLTLTPRGIAPGIFLGVSYRIFPR